jgi:hypothetical protein
MRDVPNVVVFAVVVVTVVGAVAMPVSALGVSFSPVVSDTDTTTDEALPQTTDNGTETAGASDGSDGNASVEPGQRLAGVVGVQGAEIAGEMSERSLATRVSRADSNASKAAVVASDANQIRDRLADLRDRQQRLREAHRSGEISTGEFRARMAVTGAQVRSLRTQIDANAAVSRDLPDGALESSGVDRTELDRLRDDADELRGPEVAEMAREIAGENPGREIDPERGPGELPEPARGDDKSEDEEDEEDDEDDETGPPEGAGNGDRQQGTDDGRGNSDDAGKGNADDSGDGRGNSDDAGKGNADDSDGSDDAGGGDSGGSDGNGNSGDGNSGDGNSGDGNSGDGNSGDGNSGNGNSGGGNSGDGNSGDGNSGNGNSGGGNSGDGNSGNGNSGDGNSGDGNSGNGNSGNGDR